MKRILIGAAILMLTINCPAEMKQALTLQMESGARIVYFLDSQPTIGFEGQTMLVTADAETSSIAMNDVNHWEIGMAEFMGLQPIIDEPSISIYGNTVKVSLQSPAPVSIFDLNGRAVATTTAAQSEFMLPRGVYIISISNQTYKIALR